MYFFLKARLLCTSLIISGILPKIKPINEYFVCIGYDVYKNFKRLPKRTIPINAPIPKGRRYKKFFLKSLKRFRTLLTSLSYIPKITQKTPLLIPGSIAPAPIHIPLKISLIKLKLFIH